MRRWGAEEEGVSGRQTERKALIAVAAEERGRGLGRIACSACATPGGQFDALRGGVGRREASHRRLCYEPLEKKGYRIASSFCGPPQARLGIIARRVPDLGSSLAAGHAPRRGPRASGLASTSLCSASPAQLSSRGKLFYRVQQAVAVDPTPYRSIVADWDAEAP